VIDLLIHHLDPKVYPINQPNSPLNQSNCATGPCGTIGTSHYGKKKFDSEGEEAAEIRTKISFDLSILKTKNTKQNFPIEFE
jgi:hypothetical protein